MEDPIAHILNSYSKLILAIEDDCNFDPLWRRFYQIQMHMYLLSKKNFEFKIDEAEQVYDLIVRSWTDLKSYVDNPVFNISNIDNIFKNTIIDFPIDELTISDFNSNDDLFYGSN